MSRNLKSTGYYLCFGGPPGSGKTTLLEILSGAQKQSSGDLYFENFTYETNWFGKVKKHDEIFYNYGFDDYGTGHQSAR